MDDYKKKFKEWLKKENKDRYWLAEQCQVDKRTIDKWFGKSNAIPTSRILIINNLIEKSEKIDKELDQIECHFNIRLSNDDFEKFSKQALKAGMTVGEYALYAMELLVKMDRQTELERPLPYAKSPQGGRIDDNIIWGKRPKGDIA